jgi:hypothetical protein
VGFADVGKLEADCLFCLEGCCSPSLDGSAGRDKVPWPASGLARGCAESGGEGNVCLGESKLDCFVGEGEGTDAIEGALVSPRFFSIVCPMKYENNTIAPPRVLR